MRPIVGSDRESFVLPRLSTVGLLCLFLIGSTALTVAGIRGGGGEGGGGGGEVHVAGVGSVLKLREGSITLEGFAPWEENGSGEGKGSTIQKGSEGGEGSATEG